MLMLDSGAGLLLTAITTLFEVYTTVRSNKRAAETLIEHWRTLGEQVRDLQAVGKIGAAQTAFDNLLALAAVTEQFLRRFGGRGVLGRNFNYAADRDRFRELAERLAAEVALLKLGLTIDAKTALLQMEEAHAQDMSELHDDLSAMNATATQTAAQTDEIKAMMAAVLAHVATDARPRAAAATLALRLQAETPTIKLEHLVVDAGRPLGRGSYGTVRCAQWLGVSVAIKQAPVADERAVKAMMRELRALQALHHPFVVQLLGFADAEEAGELWAVLELALHGSLEKVLALPEPRARDAALCATPSLPGASRCWLRVGAQLATALAFLHARGVVHGDLKPANALVFGGGVIKLSDFGLASLTRSMLSANHATARSAAGGARGTAAYAAPDAGEGGELAAADDVFSLGIMLCQMLSGEVPFAGYVEQKIIYAIGQGVRPTLPADAPAPWRALVGACWAGAPDERPSAADARAKLSGWLCAEEGRAIAPQQLAFAHAVPIASTQPMPVVVVVGVAMGGAAASAAPGAPQTHEGLLLEAERHLAAAKGAKESADAAAREATRATEAAARDASEAAARANGGGCMAVLTGTSSKLKQAAADAAAREATAHAHASRAADAAAIAVVALDTASEADKAARSMPTERELGGMPWRSLVAHLRGTAHLCALARAHRALAAAHAERIVDVVAERTGREGETDVAIRAGGLLPQLAAAMCACAASARLQEAALDALCNLADGVDARAHAAAEAGALPPLVAAMRAHADRALVQERACKALGLIVRGVDARARAAVAVGALPALVASMRAGNAVVQERACAGLSLLTRGSDARAQAAVDAGALPQLVASARAHASSAAVQTAVAAALCDVASSDARARAVVDADALPALFAALRAHADSEAVREGACAALRLVGGADARALPQLVDAMHAGSAAEQVGACAALVAAARGSDTRAKAVADAGALPQLVASARAHAGNEAVQEAAAAALRAIAAGSDARASEAVDAGALPLLVASMRAHAGSAAVQAAAAEAMAVIATGSDARAREATDAGALPLLVAAMSTHGVSAAVQAAAADALAAVCVSPDATAAAGALLQNAAKLLRLWCEQPMPSLELEECLGVYALVPGRAHGGQLLWKHTAHELYLAYGGQADGVWLVRADVAQKTGPRLRLRAPASPALIVPFGAAAGGAWSISVEGAWREAPALSCARLGESAVPAAAREAAAREAAAREVEVREGQALDALCAKLGESRAELLATKEIDWTGKGIGGDRLRVQGVAVLLKRNRALTGLDLDNNGLGNEDVRVIAAGLEGYTTLRVLNLRRNQVGDVGVAALAQVVPSMTSLRKIYLAHNQIGGGAISRLAAKRPDVYLNLDF